MPLADWVRKLFQSEERRTRSAARRPEEFVQLRVRRMEERRVFAVTAVTAGTANPVAEGSTFSLTGASYQDSAASTPFNGAHTITVNWGDGTGNQSLSVLEPTAANTPTAITGSHVYANNGNYDVTITVKGADNTQITSAIMTVAVSNVPPTPNAHGPYVTGAGGTVVLNGTATDPGTADTLTYTWDLDGDGNFGETGGAATRGNETGQTPTFDGSAMVRGTQQTVTLRVSDGTTSVDTTTTVTRNDLPTISAISDIATPKGMAPAAINFTIGDAQTAAGSLTLSATSSNSAVVNDVAGSFTFGGSGANRTLTLAPVANAVGTTTITITVTDGNGESSQETFDVRFNAPPTVTPTVANLTYAEGDGPVVLDGGVTLADADGSTLTGAIITVTVFDGAAEELGFTTQNGISGVYAAGTLTLTGNATLAQYQAAIRSITYENSSNNPTTTDRTIGISVTDGLNTSNIGTRTLKLAAVNDAPTLAGANNLTAINEDQTNATNPGTLVSALISGQITDPDGVGQGIAVTGVDNTNGTWQYTINGGTNWLDFNGPALSTARLLAADAQTRVRFVPNADFNGTVTGGLTYQAWDRSAGTNGGTADATTGGTSTPFSTASFSSDITVNPVNDAPTVTTTGGASTYTEGSTGVVIDAGVSVADIDDANMESATVTITNYAGAEDQLVYVNGTVPGIAGGYSNGVLTLTGSASKADYTTALQSVKYHNTSNAPTAGNRVISFSVNDGDDDTVTAPTKTVTVVSVNSAPSLSGGNDPTAVDEDVTNVANTGTLVSDIISGQFSDPDGPLQGIAVVLASNANGNWQYTTDGTTWLSLNGVSSSSARLLLADGVTRVRFVPTANYNGSFGGLQIRAWDGFTGANGNLADVSTNGGTTPYGQQLVTLSMTVNSVNDAPTLSGTANMPTIAENISAASNTGTLVSTLISGRTTDVEGASVGIAVTAVDNSKGSWQYSVDGGTNWIDFGSPSATAALLLTADAQTRVRFQPLARYNGTVSGGLTFRAWDQTSGVAGSTADTSTNGTPTAFSSTTASASITVTGVNDKPELVQTDPNVEYQKGGPQILIDATITIDDPDSATMGQAIVKLTNRFTNDQLALAAGYTPPAGITVTPSSTSGTLTLTLSGVATVAQYQDVLRHIVFGNSNPTNPNGTIRQVTFQVNDGSLNSDVVTYSIDVDRKPALTVPNNVSFTEGGGDVSIATGVVTIVDGDDADMTGAVITLSLPPTTTGEDQFVFSNQNGITGVVTNDGTNLILTLSGSASKAFYVLAIQSIKYRNTSDAPQTATRTLTFTVSDGTLDSNTVTRNLAITAVNDAPVLSGANNLTAIAEDVANGSNPGTLVSDLIAGQMTDPDGAGALQGIAVTAVDNTNGTWQYSTNNGGAWTNFGTPSGTSSRLLAADTQTRIRFIPNADFNGAPTITFRGWDRTTGTAGGTANTNTNGTTTAFSTATASPSITVTAVNDAPVLAGTANLASIAEDVSNASNTGTLVSTLVAGQINDVDGTLTGIAVTAVDNTNGAWQYTVDGGTNWLAFGTPSASTARLLQANAQTRVRFVPSTNFNGTVTGGLTFYAWDGTSGTAGSTGNATTVGGATAFSATTASASITVTAVNDSPVLAGTANLTSIAEDVANASNPGTLVSALVTGQITDPDGTLTGIAVTSVDNTNGTWQYSVDGGTVWLAFGTPTAATARLLQTDSLTRVRFVPNADFNGTVAGLTFRAWDGTSGTVGSTGDATTFGGATAFSGTTATASITVTAVDDPPRISNVGGTSIFTENGTALTLSSTITVVDPEGDNIQSMTITITNYTDVNDQLLFTNQNGITGSYSNGVLTLTGTTTAANYTTALRSIRFLNTSDNPVQGDRTISFSGRDINNADTLTPLPTKTVTVNAVNDAPTFTTPPAAAITIAQDVTSAPYTFVIGDLDDAATTLVVTGVSSDQGIIRDANIVFSGTGANRTVTFTPEPGVSADVTITLTVRDSSLASSTFQIAVKVNNPPKFVTPPVGTTVNEDSGTVQTTLTVADTETAAGSLVVTAVSDNQAVIRDADIWVEITSGGDRIVHTPLVANYSGTVHITVTVTDAGGSKATAVYTIVVNPVNDTPTIQAGQNIETNEDASVTITLLADDGDPDYVQNLTFTILAGPFRGTLVHQSGSTFVYTPFANFSGPDQFVFVVTDDGSAGGGALTSSLALFTVNVKPVADAPTIPIGFVIRGNENTLFAPNLPILTPDLDGSEAITAVRIENVHPDIDLRLSDGTPLLPSAVAPITGRKTYDLTYGQFLALRIYAPDNFKSIVDTTFQITATSTDTATFTGPGLLGTYTSTTTTIRTVGVDIVNVAPNISSLFGTNVDSNASTTLSGRIDDAPRDTMKTVVIQWGRSFTGFPQTTTLFDVPPGATLLQQFTFLVAPNPADPSAPIEIIVTATDKDGGVSTATVTIQVPGTGIPTPIVRDLGFIDPPSLLRAYSLPETPDVRTTIPTSPSGINERRAVAQQVKSVERTVEIRKVRPSGIDVPTSQRLRGFELSDLQNFLKDLPDGHYRVYLHENDLTMPRMLADVVVFRGRPVAAGDLQADRPPREFRTPTSPTATPDIPPVAKTPGPNDTTSDRSEGAGPRLPGALLRGPGLRESGPSLDEAGAPSTGESNGPGLRRPNLSTPDLNELRGPVP